MRAPSCHTRCVCLPPILIADGDVDAILAVSSSLAAADGIPVASVLSGYKDAKGRSVLHFAASFGFVDAVAAVLDAGVRWGAV